MEDALTRVTRLAAHAAQLLRDDADARPVLAYFGVLGGALAVVAGAWAAACSRGGARGLLGAAVSAPLAATALYVCWGHILAFMARVAKDKGCGPGLSPAELLGCSTPAWQSFDVFVQAYVDVSSPALGWASSAQLLLFVLSGCSFLHCECARLRVSRAVALAYVLVGFLGAISLAFPLLFAHLAALRSATPRAQQLLRVAPSRTLLACGLAAMLGVVVLPLTHRSHRASAYRFALMLVHVVLAVPALLGRPAPEPAAAGAAAHRRAALRLALWYAFLAGASLILHAHNVARAVLELPEAAQPGWWGPHQLAAVLRQLVLGPWQLSECQQSISYDVLFTTVAAQTFMATQGAWTLAALAPLLGIATAFPAFLAIENAQAASINDDADTPTTSAKRGSG
jgi:hypothetical protein